MVEDKRHPIVERRTIALTQDEEDLLDNVINKKRIYEDYSSAVRSAIRIAFGHLASCKERKISKVASE